MPTPPPHKRFQIHLSTAIVMMFVAGGLIWANTRVNRTEFSAAYPKMTIVDDEEYHSHRPDREESAGLLFRYYGMPFDAKHSRGALWMSSDNYHAHVVSVTVNWSIKAVTLDALVACAALLSVGLLCEWLIRRRAARKGA